MNGFEDHLGNEWSEISMEWRVNFVEAVNDRNPSYSAMEDSVWEPPRPSKSNARPFEICATVGQSQKEETNIRTMPSSSSGSHGAATASVELEKVSSAFATRA